MHGSFVRCGYGPITKCRFRQAPPLRSIARNSLIPRKVLMSSPARLLADPLPTRELEALLVNLDADSLRWVSGFVAGLAAGRLQKADGALVSSAALTVVPAAPLSSAPTVTVLYASQTGNGRRVAEKLGKALEAGGFAKQIIAAGDYSLKQLAQERYLYIVASTHGDGEPPDDARPLLELLAGRRAPRLDQLGFAVLALGDSSYPQFCATGRLLDARLEELGARRLFDRVECDVDFEGKATAWVQQSVAKTGSELGLGSAPTGATGAAHEGFPALAAATREEPVEIEVVVNQRITARDADKDVRHIELLVPQGRFPYQAGDALGVWLNNPPALVEQTLAAVALEPTELVSVDGRTHTLIEWLSSQREVTRVARGLIERLAALSGDAALAALLKPGSAVQLREKLKTWQVPDLLMQYPAQWTGERLVRALHPLTPRLYSIASAPEEVGEEIHITVAVVDEIHEGNRHQGAISSQLQSFEPGKTFSAFIEPNARFRLPASGATDVIMIGPGTGIAPFRGFVQARANTRATGRNWLIFGGRRRDRDFLYQTEWLTAVKKGHLAHLDVAFSRDTAQKVYVQQRLLERGAELFHWLDSGAHLYVCGDAERMAPDVHAALIEIVATHGGRTAEEATTYVSNLASSRRYLRDVY